MREDRRQPQSTVQTLKHNSRAGRISRDLLTDTNRRFEGQQMDDIALKRSRDGEKNRFGRNVGRETSRGEKQAIGRKESWNRKRDKCIQIKALVLSLPPSAGCLQSCVTCHIDPYVSPSYSFSVSVYVLFSFSITKNSASLLVTLAVYSI